MMTKNMSQTCKSHAQRFFKFVNENRIWGKKSFSKKMGMYWWLAYIFDIFLHHEIQWLKNYSAVAILIFGIPSFLIQCCQYTQPKNRTAILGLIENAREIIMKLEMERPKVKEEHWIKFQLKVFFVVNILVHISVYELCSLIWGIR